MKAKINENEKCVRFDIPLSYYDVLRRVLEAHKVTDTVFVKQEEGSTQFEVLLEADKITIAATVDGVLGHKATCKCNGKTIIETFNPAYDNGSGTMI